MFVTKYNLMSKDNLIVPMLEDAATAVGESEAWLIKLILLMFYIKWQTDKPFPHQYFNSFSDDAIHSVPA